MCAKTKSKLSRKTRKALALQRIRKNYTAEQHAAIKKEFALRQAAKRATETPEQREERLRDERRRTRKKRNHQKAKEKYLRIKSILDNVKPLESKKKSNEDNVNINQIENAERQVALGEAFVKALAKKLEDEVSDGTQEALE